MFNADTIAADSFPPIPFTLDGAEYSVTNIESDTLTQLASPDEMKPRDMREQLASLANVDPKVFKHTDTRKIILVIRHIVSEISKQLETIDSGKLDRGDVADQSR